MDSKGDVKEFFGLRFGRFSARVQMVFGSFCICRCLHGVLHRLGMCSVAPKIVLCGCASVAVLDCFNLIMWLPKVT